MVPILKPAAATLALLTLSALPAPATAGLILSFTGTVSPGSSGWVSPYDGEDYPYSTTSFDGQPFSLTVSLTGAPGNLYMTSFTASWSGQTYTYPYSTGYGGRGYPITPDYFYDGALGFYSTVSLGSSGGSIQIEPTPGFVFGLDADVELKVDFTFSQPQDPFSSFTDTGLTGGGSASTYFDFDESPVIGPYDAGSDVTFAVSSLSLSAVPEPSTWAMMLLGFAGLGAAVRSRRTAALQR